ncbi:peptidoglycan editing factor PgeF [Glacieibacterium frigidum]|uniref:Purine nucleoside phosphorylase n=1 Tax=Glacieibacterium frigidum TaxID=2593303 RepID=A0A552UAR3_9SPHN|nr:peptidoglycan editing factor PgeF [Glacieibacterium frigidum]
MAGTRHGFLGRQGGVSGGIYASLNCGLGSGDDQAAVRENRARAVAAVAPGAALVTLHQVHSPTVVTVTEPFADDARPRADGMATATPGLALAILAADCAPVLFADVKAGVIGAAHAGWRPALSGVLSATVEAMVALGARRERIAAAIGPTIGRRSYEVDDGFRDRFLADDDAHDDFFAAGRAGHWQFDLEGFIVRRLAGAGLTTIAALGLDTYADAERWFSYRRTTHAGEADYGRQISMIAL